ncbi:MAG: hypothetical protein WCY19_01665 [Candidatus Gastranaerophilaceae bacterium]
MIQPIGVTKTNLIKALWHASVPQKPINSDKYVKISNELDGKLFNYIDRIKSTIANYAKKNDLKVKFLSIEEGSDKLAMEVQRKEMKVVEQAFPNVFDVNFGNSSQFPFYLDDVTLKTEIPVDFSKDKEPLSRVIFKAVADLKNKPVK